MISAPTKIVLHRQSQSLEVVFGERSYQLPAEYLRVFSPSAEVKGHGPGQEVLQLDKHDVKINSLEPQGRYGIRIIYDDGHGTGIYSWDYLSELGETQEQKMADYRLKVEAHKKTHGHSAVRWLNPK